MFNLIAGVLKAIVGGITVASVSIGVVLGLLISSPFIYATYKTNAETKTCKELGDLVNKEALQIWQFRNDDIVLGTYCGQFKSNSALSNQKCPGFSVPQYSGYVPPCPP